MSGPKPLHAGDGYEYLTRQVATQDRDRDRSRDLTDYYTDHGTPPGTWWGKGAELMGISGQVTERQMQALFGEGLHPDADRIIAEAIDAGKSVAEAMKAAKIGRMLSEYSPKKTEIGVIYDRKIDEWIKAHKRRPNHDERMMVRTDAAHEHLREKLGRNPTKADINAALGAEKKQTKRGVTGFDCVFSPPKSVSVLWGLADDGLRRAIYECHRDAVLDTLKWAEEHYALTRRGAGGIRQIDAKGLAVALFEHWDNRTGDPNPHTHCTFSAKTLGADGEWSALDARALFAGGTTLSCMYNALSNAYLKHRIGFAFQDVEHRGKEPVLEVADVPKALRDLFSRRPDIVRLTEELIADYRATHGRSPNKKTQIKLAEEATLRTRNSKPLPKSLREMVTEWDGRAREFFGDGRSGQDFVDEVLYWHTHPDAIRPYDPHRVAVGVGVDLGGKSGIIGADPTTIDTTIAHALQRCRLDNQDQFLRASVQIRSLLDPQAKGNALEAIDIAVAVREARIYDPVRIAHEVTEKVARRRATWTEAHIRNAVWDRLARCDFPDVATLRTSVEDIVRTVRDQHSLQLTVDPDEYPRAVCRRNGESQFNELGLTTVRYTSQPVLDAENYVRDAAQTPTTEFVTGKAVDRALAQVEAEETLRTGRDFAFNSGQRTIVQHLCTSGMRLDVAIGAAGAGKTTAMKAVVRAWQNDGRPVIALAPSAGAAEVLSADIGIDANTIDSLLWRVRTGNDPGIAPGTMILVDEAAMASNPNLHQLQLIADRSRAVVKYVGDPYQLSAVESGGLMRTIAQETRAPQLLTVVRFTTDGEAEASLEVRNGDARTAYDWYKDTGRITSGMTDELRGKILTEYLNDRAAGVSSLMMAATVADVHDLNGAAQAALAARDEVKAHGAVAALSDGHRGYLGDTVVTRKNNNRLRVTRGKRSGASVDNGNLWRIRTIHRDGSLTVVGADHRGTVHLPLDYVKNHVELGYATTVHRAQGMTVERAYLLLNRTLGRALAYVGLTRGRKWNGVYVATDTAPDPGVEEQPEDPDEPVTDRDIWLRVLAREDDNLTATEVMRAEQARISDPERLRHMYDEVCAMLADNRGRELLDRALPVVIYHDISNSEHFPSLLDTIAVADAHRLDGGAMIAHIVTAAGTDDGESLVTARDATAVLRARADAWIAERLPTAPTSYATAAAVETLAVSVFNDADTLTAAVVALNTQQVLSTTQRRGKFYAVRDAEFDGVAPVPSRHRGMNTDLADFAEELRSRLLSGGAAHPQPATPPVPATEPEQRAALDNYTDEIPDPRTRRARMRGDYADYVRGLERARARYLLDRALPAALLRTVENGRGYTDLLDTIGLADAHALNTGALVADIVSNSGRDDGESLLSVSDAAAVLRARADNWIRRYLIPLAPTTARAAVETLSLTGSDPTALTQVAVTLNARVDTLAVEPQFGHRFRALEDVDPPRGLRPIPPEHNGMDIAVADFADELRRRILTVPDNAPDWRTRATARRIHGPGTDEPLDLDDLDSDEQTAATALVEELPYPDLDVGERVTRLRADLAAARRLEAMLSSRLLEVDSTPHHLAVADLVNQVRARADLLAPIVRRVRGLYEELDDAERDIIVAQDGHRQLLHRHPSGADEPFLQSVADRIDATDDPSLRAQLTDLLNQFRMATADLESSGPAYLEYELEQARQSLEKARRFAEQIRDEAAAARHALDAAADAHPVIGRTDVEHVRSLVDLVAIADLTTARKTAFRLDLRLRSARAHAIQELAAETGLDTVWAAAQIDRRYQPSRTDIHAAISTIIKRTPSNSSNLISLTDSASVDAAVNAARRRNIEISTASANDMPPAPLADHDPVIQLVRARADALMLWAVEDHVAGQAAASAEAEAEDTEADYQRALAKKPNAFRAEDSFATDVQARIDALDPNSPMRTEMAELLEQYRATNDTAESDLTAERTRAERIAAAARARADQLRAAATDAHRAFTDRLTDPFATADPDGDADHVPTSGPHLTRMASRIETEPAQQVEQIEVTASMPLAQAVSSYLQNLNSRVIDTDAAGATDRDPRAPLWLPAPPPDSAVDEPATIARHQYAAIIDRTAVLGEQAAAELPDWTAHLGPVPDGAVSRTEWTDLATQAAAWREQYDITDPTTLLGDRPDDDNRAQAWQDLNDHADQLRTHAIEEATRNAEHQAAEHERQQQEQRQRDLDEEHHHNMYRGQHPGSPDHPIGPEI